MENLEPEVVDNQTAPTEEVGQASEANEQNANEASTELANEVPAKNSSKVEQADKKPVKESVDSQKNYNELRKVYTKTTQENAALKKQMAELKKLVEESQKATRKPLSPEESIAIINQKGLDGIREYIAPDVHSQVNGLRQMYDPVISGLKEEVMAMRIGKEIESFKSDKVNYPDFEALEAKMMEFAENPMLHIDLDAPLRPQVDILYKLAKAANSEEAIRQAHELGRKEAEAGLAKEARTAVAGGGKSLGTASVDPRKLSLSELEKMIGFADR